MTRLSMPLALLCLSGLVGRAHAQPAAAGNAPLPQHPGAPLEQTWSLAYDEALARVERAPELHARTAAAQQLRGARREVGALASDLALSVEAGPRLTPDVRAQGRATISQGFVLSALGDARRAVLGAQAQALDAERAQLLAARRVQTSSAWLRVHLGHRALGIAQAEQLLAEQLARSSARGAELEELTRADSADAAAYAAEARLEVLSAEGELSDARLELTHALAVPDHVLDVRGEPPELAEPSPVQVQQLHARISQQPALVQLVQRGGVLAARERELSAAHASQLSIGLSIDRSDPDAWAALGVLGFTLPLQERSRRERAELGAERSALAGTLAEQRASWHVAIERLLHEIRHSGETLKHAETQLLPAVEDGLAAREALFRSGEGTVLEIIVARRAALALRMRHARLRSDWLAALARFRELARAVGMP